MKLVLFATAALAIGSVAIAQETPAPTPPAEQTPAPEATPPEAAAPVADAPAPAPAPVMAAPAGTPTTVAPGNQAPERDARGIAVVSDAATAPVGANQMVQVQPGAQVVAAPNQSAVFSTQASSKTYPPCSKGVTDGCVQTYERGSRKHK